MELSWSPGTSPHSECIHKRIKNRLSKSFLPTLAHSPNAHWHLAEHTPTLPHTGILFNFRNEENSDTGYNLDEP
jgi:hypothetical protein